MGYYRVLFKEFYMGYYRVPFKEFYMGYYKGTIIAF